MAKRFSVIDRASGETIIKDATAEECAAAIGIKPDSFRMMVSRARRKDNRRYRIESPEMWSYCRTRVIERDPETGEKLHIWPSLADAAGHCYCHPSTMSHVVCRSHPYEHGIAPDGHRYDREERVNGSLR